MLAELLVVGAERDDDDEKLEGENLFDSLHNFVLEAALERSAGAGVFPDERLKVKRLALERGSLRAQQLGRGGQHAHGAVHGEKEGMLPHGVPGVHRLHHLRHTVAEIGIEGHNPIGTDDWQSGLHVQLRKGQSHFAEAAHALAARLPPRLKVDAVLLALASLDGLLRHGSLGDGAEHGVLRPDGRRSGHSFGGRRCLLPDQLRHRVRVDGGNERVAKGVGQGDELRFCLVESVVPAKDRHPGAAVRTRGQGKDGAGRQAWGRLPAATLSHHELPIPVVRAPPERRLPVEARQNVQLRDASRTPRPRHRPAVPVPVPAVDKVVDAVHGVSAAHLCEGLHKVWRMGIPCPRARGQVEPAQPQGAAAHARMHVRSVVIIQLLINAAVNHQLTVLNPPVELAAVRHSGVPLLRLPALPPRRDFARVEHPQVRVPLLPRHSSAPHVKLSEVRKEGTKLPTRRSRPFRLDTLPPPGLQVEPVKVAVLRRQVDLHLTASGVECVAQHAK
mmetsp:Transcript_26870/g.88161  ORF Transcript_26870/g.88161 Transcript_26870/m.88161 type:complete len:503 (-) Transcript_26870:863-2371(-)